ncbi:hypothetical protein DFP73DRAFT_551553 [Morchella snyderi]|nr:hypothetical protein DFP73DRAFT_551553 [Morchella snyderi]
MSSSDLPLAPYGYTATGRVRKTPTKQQQASALVSAPPAPEPLPMGKLTKCPACPSDFRHRSNPNRAVWQHLLHFATVAKDKKHQESRDALKAARQPVRISEDDRKERERVNSANWRLRNIRQARRASAKGAAKLKFERNLRRAGDFSEEALKKLVDGKMIEWDSKN